MAKSKLTTDHEEIKQWAVNHEAKPEIIDEPDARGDSIGIRLDFPGKKDDRFISKDLYHEVSWEEFFKVFDEAGLGFIYEQIETEKDPSMEYRFVRLDNLDKFEEDDPLA